MLPALACLAAAQTPAERLAEGYASLGLEPRVTIQTNARLEAGSKLQNVFASIAVDNRPSQGVFRLELNVHRDGKHVLRTVGDGTWLWHYDPQANTYSSVAYGGAEGGLTTDWRKRVFSRLALLLDGPALFTARVAADAFGTRSSSGWTPWFPTARLTAEPEGVLAKAESPWPAETRYRLEDGFVTGLLHEAWPDPASYDRYATAVYRGQWPPDADFAFKAPKGARAVAAPDRQGR